MQLVACLAVLVLATLWQEASTDLHPLSDEYIAQINKKAKTWKAGKNFEIEDWERVKRISSCSLHNINERKFDGLGRTNPHDESEPVPESFDAREAWSHCDSLKQITDQSNCASCWAVGAAEAMSDRICIHSNQTKQVYVSAEDVLSCCSGYCGVGCRGGSYIAVWYYWKTDGIVTGGLYNSSQGCKDYSMEPCIHDDNRLLPRCKDLHFDTPPCVKSCYDTSLNYEDSLTFGQGYDFFSNEKQMQLEIYKNGPIVAPFAIYDDFPSYKSGVYHTTSEKVIGGLSAKILGWGVEDGEPYWLIANSWNAGWGDKGYIKFLRGSNQCGIELAAIAGLPVL